MYSKNTQYRYLYLKMLVKFQIILYSILSAYELQFLVTEIDIHVDKSNWKYHWTIIHVFEIMKKILTFKNSYVYLRMQVIWNSKNSRKIKNHSTIFVSKAYICNPFNTIRIKMIFYQAKYQFVLHNAGHTYLRMLVIMFRAV